MLLRPGENSRRRQLALLAIMTIGAFLLSACTRYQDRHAGRDAINTGSTAWMLISTALVMLMTPALACFYGGLVRSKNVLSVVMQCFIALGVITLQWIVVGYSLSFGPSLLKFSTGPEGNRFIYGFLGSLDWFCCRKVGMTPYLPYAGTIPHRLFMLYQCMFAVIAPALIAGAFAERMKFRTYLVFILLWTTFVYDPVAHWVWSENGWLRQIGSIDFAGGTVVHMTSGFTALLVAIMIRPRRGFPREAILPHNLVYTALGAGLLWFGWFGFNAGSALDANGLAVVALLATHLAAAAGAVSWMALDWVWRGKPTLLGAASGAIAGLVAITPASGYVGPISAIIIGALAGVICAYAVVWRARKGIDDALDAFGIHGVGGTLGALLTGVFASRFLNSNMPSNGLIHGGVRLMLMQCVAVVVTIVYTIVVSWVILKVLDLTMGLRVTSEEEQMGLDLTQHEEAAYSA